ncbi:protein slx4 [Aspergillus undulatus]|uniref:protein slx4 n=1 Tax=Aspergillus undulatus TaxID=1810928 RepID=UPI003CCD31A7
MQTATDCIVLSSSPEHDAIDTLVVGKLLRNPRLSRSPSPPKISRPPTRSKYFATSYVNRTKTTDVCKKKQTTADSNDASLEEQPKRRGKKSKAAAQMEVQDVDQAVSENKENAPTKPKRTRKKQGDNVSGVEKFKNKTITGRVAKSGATEPKASAAKPVNGDSTPKITRERSAGSKDKDDCDEGLHLELAVKRRLDWTPMKENANSVAELDDKGDTEGGQNDLGSLLSGYEYDGTSSVGHRVQALGEDGPTKRRRIDLVDPRVLVTKPKSLGDDSTQNSEEEAPVTATSKLKKKPKPRAKQPKTLTARMTALYKTSTDSDSTDQGLSITGGSSTTAKLKARKTKEKTGERSGFKFPPSIVLPPEAAVKSLDQQDLVFGTCSQLEREDSPILLRDTQAALRESEKEMSTAPLSHSKQHSKSARHSSEISRYAPSKNLWSVAARDGEGSLVNVEVVDLSDSPEVVKIASPPINDNSEKDDEIRSASEPSNASCVMPTETSSLGHTPASEELPELTAQITKPTTQKFKAPSVRAMPHYKGKTDLELAKEIQSYGLRVLRKRDANIELLEKCWTAKHGPVTQAGAETSQLEDVTSTSSASRTQQADQSSKESTTATRNKSKAQTQPQPRTSRPIKGTIETTSTQDTDSQPAKAQASHERTSQPTQTRSFIDVEEIQDSEDEDSILSPTNILHQFLTKTPRNEELGKKQITRESPTSPTPSIPSPIRSPKRKAPSQPRRANAKTPRLAAPNPDPDANAKLPNLTDQITKAVIAQPRQSQSPAGKLIRPSWHEKILMYDPIYLEDFTAWLNTEGLELVHEDREVWPALVREWCEMKGVCCCFRVKKGVGFH